MKIGIGLPNTIPGTDGRMIIEWARRAEEHGFSSLATLDRIAYPSYESLVVLAAAAGATERIGLLTNVLLGPTRNPVLLAKQAASLDQLSGGRFTLGASVGSRQDDFTLVGADFHNRGKRWDHALELMHRIWAGEPVEGTDKPVGPTPTNGHNVPMLIGGTADKVLERLVRYGVGWTAGGAGPDRAAPMVEKVRQAWKAAGKQGEPRLVALCYFGLGTGADDGITSYLSHYYGSAPWVQGMIATAPRTPGALCDIARRFEEVGFDELLFDPTMAKIEEVDLLAEAVL